MKISSVGKDTVTIEMRVGNKFFQVATHIGPHLDEICAAWLIEKNATPEFVQKYAKKDIIELGIGGGAFDEHPRDNNGGRKEGECAATLAAKALGIDEDPALELILKYVKTQDLKGGDGPFGLSSLSKLIMSFSPEEAISWVVTALEAKYKEQLNFFSKTKSEFESKGDITEVSFNGGKIKIVTIKSDDSLMSKFARSKYGCGAGVVIQVNSQGQVVISTSHRYGLNLIDVARIIRYEEQKADGQVEITDWNELSKEGTIDGVGRWYFDANGKALMNGSLTHPEVPATKLTLAQIGELVRIGILYCFPTARKSRCEAGVCSSTLKDKCSWYCWGLTRCRQIRYQMSNKK